jgi:hypothetical protein
MANDKINEDKTVVRPLGMQTETERIENMKE